METPQIVALAMIGIIILEFIYYLHLKRKNKKKMIEMQKAEQENEES